MVKVAGVKEKQKMDENWEKNGSSKKKKKKHTLPFSRRPYVPEARYILFLFYQRLAVVAGRCLNWFSVNPDTLSGYTHTHTLVSRLQAEAALWAETLQNAMQNNNLPDTDAEYVDMQSSAARLPETPASFLTLKQNVGPIDLWILFCERICCVLLNNSADIRHPQVFFFFSFFSPPFF